MAATETNPTTATQSDPGGVDLRPIVPWSIGFVHAAGQLTATEPR